LVRIFFSELCFQIPKYTNPPNFCGFWISLHTGPTPPPPPGKELSDIQWSGGWSGHCGEEKQPHHWSCRELNSGRPVRSLVTILTEPHRLLTIHCFVINSESEQNPGVNGNVTFWCCGLNWTSSGGGPKQRGNETYDSIKASNVLTNWATISCSRKTLQHKLCVIFFRGLHYWNGVLGFDSRRGLRIFSSSPRPERRWGPPSLLSNWYQGLFPWV
jgi:hypothetical protein